MKVYNVLLNPAFIKYITFLVLRESIWLKAEKRQRTKVFFFA